MSMKFINSKIPIKIMFDFKQNSNPENQVKVMTMMIYDITSINLNMLFDVRTPNMISIPIQRESPVGLKKKILLFSASDTKMRKVQNFLRV